MNPDYLRVPHCCVPDLMTAHISFHQLSHCNCYMEDMCSVNILMHSPAMLDIGRNEIHYAKLTINRVNKLFKLIVWDMYNLNIYLTLFVLANALRGCSWSNQGVALFLETQFLCTLHVVFLEDAELATFFP